MTINDQSPAFRAAELAALISASHRGEVSPFRIARFVRSVQALTKRAKSHAVRMCNEADYVERWQDPETGEDRRQAKFDQKAAALITDFYDQARRPTPIMSLDIGGDPRGACGTLHIKGLAGDGFGGGFPIY
jgi:hypothetical protein